MAAGLSSDVVKAVVEQCNTAIKSIDSEIGGIDSLDVIEEIRGYAADLHKVWETENGEITMIALNKVIDTLETYINNLIKAAEDIKNDSYKFERTYSTTTTHLSASGQEHGGGGGYF